MPASSSFFKQRIVSGTQGWILLLFLFSGSLMAQVNIMTFNIRYDTESDGMDQWELRKEEVVAFIEKHQPDFLGMQEALPQQLSFLHRGLTAYEYIGYGRDGKNTNSEAVPIFYKKDRYRLLQSEVFWLSPTPDIPSKGWDAMLPRIAVYGAFQDLTSSDTLHVINTHFDHMGREARLRSAEQIVEWIKDRIPGKDPVILMGDLNCEPDSDPVRLLNIFLHDTCLEGSPDLSGGTFNGFDLSGEPSPRIDYIFTRGMNTTASGVIIAKRENGRYLSDHFPVWARVEISKSSGEHH